MVRSTDNIRIWIFKTTESGLQVMKHANTKIGPPVNKILHQTSHSHCINFHCFYYRALIGTNIIGETGSSVGKRSKMDHASR